jgi:hypothetical protein
MFRANDPFWSRQAAREGVMGQDHRVLRAMVLGNGLGLVRAWPSQVARSDYS